LPNETAYAETLPRSPGFPPLGDCLRSSRKLEVADVLERTALHTQASPLQHDGTLVFLYANPCRFGLSQSR
jgi:hypothetical protein